MKTKPKAYFTPNDALGYFTLKLEIDGQEIQYLDQNGEQSRFRYTDFASYGRVSEDDVHKLIDNLIKMEELA